MKKWRWYAGATLLALAFSNLVLWEQVLKGSFLSVTFFDVGQGDAIFIETPQGHQILIDGGPNKKVVDKVANTLPFWDKSLDLIILTHPDADHITGLVSVLEEYEVQNIVWTGVARDTDIFRSWEQALEKYVKLYVARTGQKLVWSQDSAHAFLEILYPNDSAISNTKAVNDTSIVAKLVFGSNSFLFTGDISKEVEQKLVDRQADLDADVLKVPHHGSKTSSSESFLAGVSPNLAVVQVGRNNRYGHPAPQVLEHFSAFGIPILRTDQNGDILIQSNGTKFSSF